MNSFVIVQGGEFLKRPATSGAGVRFVVLVIEPVLVIRLLKRERLIADVALVGHLA